MPEEKRADHVAQISPARRAQQAGVSQGLKQAFPLPASGSFADLILAIDQAHAAKNNKP
jgi:hypothetical protein